LKDEIEKKINLNKIEKTKKIVIKRMRINLVGKKLREDEIVKKNQLKNYLK
jgi:hypothetical protein